MKGMIFGKKRKKERKKEKVIDHEVCVSSFSTTFV